MGARRLQGARQVKGAGVHGTDVGRRPPVSHAGGALGPARGGLRHVPAAMGTSRAVSGRPQLQWREEQSG